MASVSKTGTGCPQNLGPLAVPAFAVATGWIFMPVSSIFQCYTEGYGEHSGGLKEPRVEALVWAASLGGSTQTWGSMEHWGWG